MCVRIKKIKRIYIFAKTEMVAHPCIGLIRSTPFLIDCKNMGVYGEVCLMRVCFLHIEHPMIID